MLFSLTFAPAAKAGNNIIDEENMPAEVVFDTHAPKPSPSLIRPPILLVYNNETCLSHNENQEAFLQARTDIFISMNLPPGYKELARKVERLKNAMYRLKQASNTVHKVVTSKLIDTRFEECLTATVIESGRQ